MDANFKENYDKQRRWSDRFIGPMLHLLAGALGVQLTDIRISTEAEDIRDGVDVIVSGKLYFGLRIRKFTHWERYQNQFTLRAHPNRYGMTEIQKVKAGKLHGLLYCFATEEASADDGECADIYHWSLLRLKALRLAYQGEDGFANVEGTTGWYDHCQFVAYDLDSFPAGSLVVASSGTH